MLSINTTHFLYYLAHSLFVFVNRAQASRVIGRAKRALWGVQSRFRVIYYVGMYVSRGPKSVGGNTWAKRVQAQSQYWAVKSDQ